MHILTPRLVLKPLEEKDGAALAQATDETWHDLSQWMRWATDRARFTDIAHVGAYARNCHEKFIQNTDFIFACFDKDTQDFILTSRLAPVDAEKDIYEFCGYWCRKKYQGNGYVTEAVNAISRYAFDHLGAQKIIIKHAAGNDKTRAVMDRLGFVEETILPNVHNLPDGRFVNEYILYLDDISRLPSLDTNTHH